MQEGGYVRKTGEVGKKVAYFFLRGDRVYEPEDNGPCGRWKNACEIGFHYRDRTKSTGNKIYHQRIQGSGTSM